jgi:endonuclease/exonuclease/phosphatase family metal-dependent hydrolase
MARSAAGTGRSAAVVADCRRALVFVNAHVDYEPEATTRSAQLLATWIQRRAHRLPAIVTGDFNADKESRAYRRLTRGRVLRDVFRERSGPAVDEGSFHAYGSLQPNVPIDWILASRHFAIVAADVDREQNGNRFPSDHHPVTAVLAMDGS